MSSPDDSLFGFTAQERLEYEKTLIRLTVAAHVENYLDHAGLQAKDLASRVRKSRPWISKLLSGRQNATLDTLAETAWALGARWSVDLKAAEREGTPAEGDKEPPNWAQPSTGVNQYLVRFFQYPALWDTSLTIYVAAWPGSAMLPGASTVWYVAPSAWTPSPYTVAPDVDRGDVEQQVIVSTSGNMEMSWR